MIAQAGASHRRPVVEIPNSLMGLNADLARITSKVRPSLVRVSSSPRSAGAGVVLHKRGLIVTSAHVIRGRRAEVVDHAGRQYTGKILQVDQRLDLAALMIPAEELAELPIGDSHSLTAGSWVIAFGHPFGVLGAATAGIVIGTGVDLPEMRPDSGEWLAMSTRLRPGNSGGPVVDTDGRLVGLNAMMAGPGVGLAVPGHVVKEFLQRVIV